MWSGASVCHALYHDYINMRIDIKAKRRYVKPELYPLAIKGELLLVVGSDSTDGGGLSKGDQFDFDDSFDDDFSSDPVLYDYRAWDDVEEPYDSF